MRIDLYTTIHKAPRFHMFELANAIGSADLRNPRDAGMVVTRVRDMIEHLRDHAQNEETYIHPLYDGAGASRFRSEHEELETDLRRIEHAIEEAGLQGLYAAYVRFLGTYLLHLSEEEDAQRQVLWPRYDDQTLKAVLDRFKAERPHEAAAADLAFMLPALSAPELVNLFGTLKRSAPPEVFCRASAHARQVLGLATWELLDREING